MVIPQREDSMRKVFKYTNIKYSQYYNNKMRVRGHLFQSRFFSCVLDGRHMIACARYIERNPVRAKMVRKSCLWPSSRAKIHCGINQDDPLGTNKLFDYIEKGTKGWKEWIEAPDNSNKIRGIREKPEQAGLWGRMIFQRDLKDSLREFLS